MPAGRKKGHVKEGGRVAGTPNKITKELKEMILGALDDAGGQQYLLDQSELNPVAFMSLVGKMLPKQVNANVKVVDKTKGMTTEQLKERAVELLKIIEESQ